jgi:hypothetical protein
LACQAAELKWAFGYHSRQEPGGRHPVRRGGPRFQTPLLRNIWPDTLSPSVNELQLTSATTYRDDDEDGDEAESRRLLSAVRWSPDDPPASTRDLQGSGASSGVPFLSSKNPAEDCKPLRFRVGEVIGRGSFGIVFRVYDSRLDRNAAVKILRPSLVPQTSVHKRFLREARAVQSLSHPGIISIYDVGHVDGTPFIVEELIEGPNMAQWLSSLKEPCPVKQSARLLRDLAESVHYAHSRGILHRDLKPSNVLLDCMESDDGTTAITAKLTDVQTIHRICTLHPTRPRQYNRSVPRDLEAITFQCLEKRPENRYATAAELVADLNRYSEGVPVEAANPSPARRLWASLRGHPFHTAAGALVLTGALTFFGYSQVMAARERQQQRRADENLRVAIEGMGYAYISLSEEINAGRPISHDMHMKILLKSRDFHQQLAERNPDDKYTLYRLNVAHHFAANGFSRMRNYPLAAKERQAALAVLEQLLAIDPNNADYHFDTFMQNFLLAGELHRASEHSAEVEHVLAVLHALMRKISVDCRRRVTRGQSAV